MKSLARIFKALSDETRLALMALIIEEGELCVCDCMHLLAISQSKASRHLRYLANAGLLADRRNAVWVYYRVPEDLDPARARVLDSLRGLLAPGRDPGLGPRLREWRKRKARGEIGCSAD